MKNENVETLKQFQDEHQKLLRSLLLSIQKQSIMHQDIRRLKSSLTETTMKLFTSMKVHQEDRNLINTLRYDLEQSKIETNDAKKQIEAATESINNLRLEINSLKQKLGAANNSQNNESQELNFNMNQSTPYGLSLGILADDELDSLIHDKNFKFNSTTQKQFKISTFDDWKMHNFLKVKEQKTEESYNNEINEFANMTLSTIKCLDKSDIRTKKKFPKRSSLSHSVVTSRNNPESFPLSKHSKIHFPSLSPLKPKTHN